MVVVNWRLVEERCGRRTILNLPRYASWLCWRDTIVSDYRQVQGAANMMIRCKSIGGEDKKMVA